MCGTRRVIFKELHIGAPLHQTPTTDDQLKRANPINSYNMQSTEDSADGVELTASGVVNPTSSELQQQQSPKQSPQQNSNELSASQVELFLTMHNRKLTRELNGPQKKKTKYHLVILLCFLILVYGLSSTYATTNSNPNNGEEGTTTGGGTGGDQQWHDGQ